eukprot:7544110-Ditylum_brightwellii.AAC.1
MIRCITLLELLWCSKKSFSYCKCNVSDTNGAPLEMPAPKFKFSMRCSAKCGLSSLATTAVTHWQSADPVPREQNLGSLPGRRKSSLCSSVSHAVACSSWNLRNILFDAKRESDIHIGTSSFSSLDLTEVLDEAFVGIVKACPYQVLYWVFHYVQLSIGTPGII